MFSKDQRMYPNRGLGRIKPSVCPVSLSKRSMTHTPSKIWSAPTSKTLAFNNLDLQLNSSWHLDTGHATELNQVKRKPRRDNYLCQWPQDPLPEGCIFLSSNRALCAPRPGPLAKGSLQAPWSKSHPAEALDDSYLAPARPHRQLEQNCSLDKKVGNGYYLGN